MFKACNKLTCPIPRHMYEGNLQSQHISSKVDGWKGSLVKTQCNTQNHSITAQKHLI